MSEFSNLTNTELASDSDTRSTSTNTEGELLPNQEEMLNKIREEHQKEMLKLENKINQIHQLLDNTDIIDKTVSIRNTIKDLIKEQEELLEREEELMQELSMSTTSIPIEFPWQIKYATTVLVVAYFLKFFLVLCDLSGCKRNC
jgi:hypothetical protein